MKVLVVEDSARLQTSIGAGLESLGYELDVVNDGAEAIARAADRAYDIVILDLMLPRESSLPLLHEMRELDRDLAILILSAHDQIHDRVTALIQGADDYLLKPVSIDDLHSRIQSLLRPKSGRPAHAGPGSSASAARGSPKRLIRSLLGQCRHGGADFELLISEVKLGELLEDIGRDLESELERKNIGLRLPPGKQPTLLVDARWMRLLLVELLEAAIGQSPADDSIHIGSAVAAGYASLEVSCRVAGPVDTASLSSRFEAHADCMNFALEIENASRDRLSIRLSGIRIV